MARNTARPKTNVLVSFGFDAVSQLHGDKACHLKKMKKGSSVLFTSE